MQCPSKKNAWSIRKFEKYRDIGDDHSFTHTLKVQRTDKEYRVPTTVNKNLITSRDTSEQHIKESF